MERVKLYTYANAIDRGSEENSCHTAHFLLLFDEYFKVLIDDGDGKQNAGTTANCA